MEELFSQNIFALYIIACLAVISYNNFKENQRIVLLYIFSYSICYFNILSVSIILLLLLIMTFVFLEYLSEDSAKLRIITRFLYKIYDYLFMMFFQYHVLWIIISFFSLYLAHYFDEIPDLRLLSYAWSILCLCIGAHLTISQPFKVHTISEVNARFEKDPPYSFKLNDEMFLRLQMLCDFEDNTYFIRKNSYSCISCEYFSCYLELKGYTVKSFLRTFIAIIFGKGAKIQTVKGRIIRRGYSTPEMQLLRTLGVQRGYDKYKYQRKVYEIIYSKIYFASLKEYHRSNTFMDMCHYRHYLLYIYLKTVLIKIKDKRFQPLSIVFENYVDISKWPMEALFIACLGLSFKGVSKNTLNTYSDIIRKYNLNSREIESLYKDFDTRFPII